MGTLTALKEIEWVKNLSLSSPKYASLNEYYMGYYIHTCRKMKYKGTFRPSELLCPERFTWHPLASCTKALDEKKYVIFSDLLHQPLVSSSSSSVETKAATTPNETKGAVVVGVDEKLCTTCNRAIPTRSLTMHSLQCGRAQAKTVAAPAKGVAAAPVVPLRTREAARTLMTQLRVVLKSQVYPITVIHPLV
jgi:hypothetical protein